MANRIRRTGIRWTAVLGASLLLCLTGCPNWTPCRDACPQCKPKPVCDPCSPDADCKCKAQRGEGCWR